MPLADWLPAVLAPALARARSGGEKRRADLRMRLGSEARPSERDFLLIPPPQPV